MELMLAMYSMEWSMELALLRGIMEIPTRVIGSMVHKLGKGLLSLLRRHGQVIHTLVIL